MNSHRQLKNEQLIKLAGEVKTGVIVELGAFRGEGTAALCLGSIVPVFTIDDYTAKRGWASEWYNTEDHEEYIKATRRCPKGYLANLVIGDVSHIAQTWLVINISLLIWDLGIAGRLQQDFDNWKDKVIGKFVIHDTGDQRLGTRDLAHLGWKKYREGVFWILERE